MCTARLRIQHANNSCTRCDLTTEDVLLARRAFLPPFPSSKVLLPTTLPGFEPGIP